MGLWSRLKALFDPAAAQPAGDPPATPPPATVEAASIAADEPDGAEDDIADEDDDLDDELPLHYAEPIARDRDLEAAIGADPDAAAPYLVYADWLQERGDPRGELIAVQHALRTTTEMAEHARLSERAEALLSEHGDYLAGPAKQYGFYVGYHLGFVRTLLIWRDEDLSTLRKILAVDHPALAFLRRVHVPYGTRERVAALVAELGRTSVIVVDGDDRTFEPDDVPSVTARVEVEREDGTTAITVVVEDGPFSSARGYSYLARTTFGDDTWWHGSGDALTEETVADDPMRSGTARVAPLVEPRALRMELRARLPSEETTHTLWFAGSASVSEPGPMLLVRCEPRTGAPFEIPTPLVGSPRVGPALIPRGEDRAAYAADRMGAALPGVGVYERGANAIVTEAGRIAVPSHDPRGDCYFEAAFGGAERALVLVHNKRGGNFGSWLTTTRAGELRAQVELAGSVHGGAIDPRGRWFAALTYAQRSRLVVFDIETGAALGDVDAPASELSAHGIAWHGETALVIADGAVACLDVATRAASEIAVPRMIGYGWRQYGAGVPTYHPGLARSAWVLCAEFPDRDAGDETGTTIIGWRDRGGPYRFAAVPDHGWSADSQFASVTILDDGRIVAIGSRVWVVDPASGVASDHGEPGIYAATPVCATVDGRVRLYSHGAGPWWIEL